MQCPACGYENLPGVDFCDECLSPLYHLDLIIKPKSETRMEKAILKEKIYQIHSLQALVVPPDKSLKDVLSLMNAGRKCSAVIVENNEIKGIFTERSFIKRACVDFPIIYERPIREVMAENPIVLRSTDSVVDALHLMSVVGYSYAIIKETPLRVLSITDILHYIVELYPSLGGLYKLMKELKQIALLDGEITPEEQAILDKIEYEKDSFLRIFARMGKSIIPTGDKSIISNFVDSFIPSIEKVVEKGRHISDDEKILLKKVVTYFEQNKDRFFT
ncbi:MAG: CBS domain-containing protein [Candidatus Hodarchaeales archaeon]|jgi:CBS domain-containing protein